MKDEEKAFNNFRHNGLHLNFPNGNHLSTVWGGGTYTENYDRFDLISQPIFLESNDVEIMFECSEKLQKKIEKKFNDGGEQPIGRLTITQWLEIANLLAKEQK